MSSVTLRALSHGYAGSEVSAVDRIDFTIRKGELVSLLGPSGCGKTTTLKLIAGLLKPTSGDIYFGDNRVTDVKPEQREAVMVFQNYLLFPYMSIEENVGFGLRMRRQKKPQIAAKVRQMLALMDLEDLRDRRPAQLSGGQQQRAALARALVLEPKVPRERRSIFAAVGDRLVPADQPLDLWRHWGEPRIEWYQGGHITFRAHAGVRRLVVDGHDPSLGPGPCVDEAVVRARARNPPDVLASVRQIFYDVNPTGRVSP